MNHIKKYLVTRFSSHQVFIALPEIIYLLVINPLLCHNLCASNDDRCQLLLHASQSTNSDVLILYLNNVTLTNHSCENL